MALPSYAVEGVAKVSGHPVHVCHFKYEVVEYAEEEGLIGGYLLAICLV